MVEACSNFCFPVPEKLEGALVKLVPFLVASHAEAFCASSDDALFSFLPWGPFSSTEEFVSTVLGERINNNPSIALFAVIDKATGSLAGTIGLLDASPVHLCAEIGFVITLKSFQRTHVTSHAIGLLLHWMLDTPAQGGLGLRRAAWRANAFNERSVSAAKRMGFRMEGLMRWARVLPESRTEAEGARREGPREGDPKPRCLGGDSVILGLCWDDWEGGVREQVDKIMSRVI
ncbi:acyl-CoA N-acyltransferase [Roridomyces roridus]|uniref:Acyl-CoA N-acyltransferase n=1 Tax=Roridomyces roridus TaxID=1738132 RepID=A0AAD7BAG5_9AGAR|nr:acyl-CoA N-acyltransferase [Roridomyces roridus]